MRMTCLGALPSSRPVVNCRSNPIPIGSVLLLPFMEHSICGIRSVFKEPYDVNLKELRSHISVVLLSCLLTLDIMSLLHCYSMPLSGFVMP